MKIAIDLTQIPLQKAGVGVYAKNLAAELLLQNNLHRYIFFIQDDDHELATLLQSLGKEFTTISKIKAKIFRKFAFRVLFEQCILPIQLKRHKADILHSLHYSFPLFTKTKRVVTYHDTTFITHPDVHLKVKVKYFGFFIRHGLKKIDRIITDSQSTRDDIKTLFPHADLGRIQAIPLGKSDLYHPWTLDSAAMIDVIKARFKIIGHYIIFIGTLEPRKNIVNLIRAFARNKDNFSHTLVIVGKKGWFYDAIFNEVEHLKLQDRVIFTGFVSEEEKIALLQGADVFAYPSLYEGFGIPVLEAISCGIPTLTSNLSSMPEVIGEAGMQVDPLSVDDIAAKLLVLLTDSSLRARFKDLGPKQADKFSWAKCAKQTLEVYEQLA